MNVTLLSIIILSLELLFLGIFGIIAWRRKRLISRSNAFWFLPVFGFVSVLYIIGFIHQNEKLAFVGIAKSVAAALRSFAFDINIDYVYTLLNINWWYSAAFYTAYGLAILTIVGTALSLARDFLRNVRYVFFRKLRTCDVVVGYNDSSFEYIEKHKKNTILWVTKELTKDETTYLYDNKIAFIKGDLTYKQFLRKGFWKNKRYNFIAFMEEETNYQQLIKEFQKINKDGYIVFLHLEVKYQEMELVRNQYLENKDENLNLYIRAFSRYELIARKFVTEYTIPSFLDDSYFNENKTIKSDKKINVIFYGFGKINSSLFTMFCQNNQLVQNKDGKLASKVVDYYIIDRDKYSKNDKRLDYLVQSFKDIKSDFGDLEMPCNLTTLEYDINGYNAITKLKDLVADENSYNIIFVSYGTDYENAETAIWLEKELSSDRVQIICRLKEQRLKDDKVIYFGNEKEVISQSYIVDEELQQLARDINANYNELSAAEKEENDKRWEKLKQIQLYSNYYAAMNLPFKLHLLGLDLTKDKDAKSITNDEFVDIYLKDSKGSNNKYEDHFKTEIRNVIAYSEKLRWNAYYLFNGFKPMNKDLIDLKDGKMYYKDEDIKLHGCLTSHAGLHSFHEYIVNHPDTKGKYKLEDVDFYKYDYMVFDNPENSLVNNLLKQGYKIIKKK